VSTKDAVHGILIDVCGQVIANHQRVAYLVEILMGDIYQKFPGTLAEFFEMHGVTKEQFDAISPSEAAAAFRARVPTRTQTLTVALDLLFNARYGWPEGTAGRLTPWQALVALEHAVNYNAPGKPRILEITK
jgi:hypothetical protein